MNPVAQHKERREAQQSKNGDLAEPAAEGSQVVARRRVFLRLEAQRESLAAQLWRRLRVRRRYEDLCLVKMVTRLERDYLSQPTPGRSRLGVEYGIAEYGIADWARPWGVTFLLQFQADLNVFDLRLKSCRRWLSAATQRAAEARAAQRFASFTAGMAGELEAAGLRLPVWASGRLPSRRPAPWRAGRRGAPRAASRRGASRRASSGSRVPRTGARRDHGRATARSRLNLNQASFAELRSLKLSLTQSRRVLAFRKRIGGYESVEQLDEIPGFPRAVRERLKRQVTI